MHSIGGMALTELWERFSFYGLQSILSFYLLYELDQGGLALSPAASAGIVGAYGGAVYIAQLIGAWLGERVLSPKRLVLIGGIVIAYNLEGIEELRLTPEVISGIYTGRITEWSDPAIRELNPDITLPDQRVIPIYRTDGSGTTFVFSSYMSKVDSVWREELGAAKTLDIKVGNAAKGNPGVAGVISSTPGAIGYIGSEYSMALGIPAAAIRNRSGHFIAPTMESISLSANLSDFPDDTRVMIADSPDPDAYPISTMTWLIVYKEQSYGHRSLESARLLQDFLYYIVGEETHEAARKTHYASLPPLALEKARAVIASMTYQGKPLSEP